MTRRIGIRFGTAAALGLALGLACGLARAAAAQQAPGTEAPGTEASADLIGDLMGAPPAPPAEPPPTAEGPVYLDQTGRTPEGPPTATDRNYEARLRASFASAQGLQGPLDGRWILSAAGGGDLYALQLVDTGGGSLEGAWRDVRRTGAFEGSGFLSDIQRTGSTLTLRFQPAPRGPAASASLSPTADGRWTGDLEEGGRRSAVVMRRD